MAWINLEVIEIRGKVYGVNVMLREDKTQAIFETREEADLWLEKNHKELSYHTIEVW